MLVWVRTGTRISQTSLGREGRDGPLSFCSVLLVWLLGLRERERKGQCVRQRNRNIEVLELVCDLLDEEFGVGEEDVMRVGAERIRG